MLHDPAQKPRYRLSTLLAQCDPNAPVPDDLRTWDTAPPVGREPL